jgi:hypothetical protein
MTTEANFPLQQLCLKPSLYGRFSLDHLWPLLGDHRGASDFATLLYKVGSIRVLSVRSRAPAIRHAGEQETIIAA